MGLLLMFIAPKRLGASESLVWLSDVNGNLCEAIDRNGSRSGDVNDFCATNARTKAYLAQWYDEPASRAQAVWETIFLPISDDPRRRLRLNEDGRLGLTDRRVRRDLRRIGIDGDEWQALQFAAIKVAKTEYDNRRRIVHEKICDRRSSFETKDSLARAVYEFGTRADVELEVLVENALLELNVETVETIVQYALTKHPTVSRVDVEAFVPWYSSGVHDIEKVIDRTLCW